MFRLDVFSDMTLCILEEVRRWVRQPLCLHLHKKPEAARSRIEPENMLPWDVTGLFKTHIQSVSRLVDITAGGNFLCLCDRKSSYKHVSDFGQLWSYGHFLIPVHALVWTALRNQLAGDVLNLLDYRLRCKHYFCHLIAALSIVIIWLELSSTPQSTDDSNVYGQKT